MMKNIVLDNKSSMRKAFGASLVKLGESDERIVVMDADLACSTQTQMFNEKFPHRFFDSGIAEQDMVATAAGLASEGKIPFISSFAMFATGRTYDQVRNSVCYPSFNVKIIGTHGGITVGEDGATHQALEDISLMRSIPGMSVIVPADSKECEEVIKYAAAYDGPMYIRVARSNTYDIFGEDYKFDPKHAVVISQGMDVTVLSNGENLSEVIKAADMLKNDSYSVEVIHVPVVKPLDTSTVVASAKKTNLLITVENHSVIGGLGSAVCETVCSSYPVKVYRLGIDDEFGQSGKADELVDYYGLSAVRLAQRIKEICRKEGIKG